MDAEKRTFYLGRYNCIEHLGTGPIGETYRAKIYGVAGFEKQFAVKRVYPHLGENEAFVARFVQAASAFAALEHPRVARVHEVNAQGAHYYIVVDLVRGLDLRQIVDLLQQRGEALCPDAAMTIARDVAETLEYAHGRTNVLPAGVLHLGLTAQSVMLTYEGEVKLVDIGLLAALVRQGWSNDDALASTLAYLAPEEWRGETVDVRADVFSLGVVLHELLGGSRAFFGDRTAELRMAIESGPPPPPPADPRLQEVVTRALQPDPERRFATVAEMRVAIEAILGGRIERARADLSALVRRLALPRERRTGAFAAMTLPPPVSELSTPVSAGPPPIPTAVPHTWAPPTPKPPIGPMLSSLPTHNTLAGIGPDDQELAPIELIEMPGAPTEKVLPSVHPEEAETNRLPRAEADEVATPPPASPRPPPIPPAAAVPRQVPAEATPIPPVAAVPYEVPAEATPIPPVAAVPHEVPAEATPSGPTVVVGPPVAEPSAAASPQNGEAVAAAGAPEPSWAPPPLEPSPPPSPEPLFAAPSTEQPITVEPARSTVPGAKLPPRRVSTRAVFVGIGLLAAAGAGAIYVGLTGTQRTTQTAAERTTSTGGASTTPAEGTAQPVSPPAERATAVARGPEAAATPPAPPTAATPTVAPPEHPHAAPTPPPQAAPTPAPQAAPTPPPQAATATPPPQTAAPTPPPQAAAPTSPPAPAGAFANATTPPGAALFVDGEPQGTTPAQLTLPAGTHKLIVAAEGQKLLRRDIESTRGGHLELMLESAKLPAEVAGAAGLKVRCKSHGEVRIFVDGADSGRSCPNEERIGVAPGTHTIGLYSPRTGQTHEIEHEVTEGDHSTRVYVRY